MRGRSNGGDAEDAENAETRGGREKRRGEESLVPFWPSAFLRVLRVLRVSAVGLVAAACSSSPAGTERLNAPGRTDTLPFSHGVVAGDLYFVAGTLGVDPATGKPPADPEQEVRAMLDDFKKKLELADLSMDDLVSVTVFCPDLALYDLFNRVYAGYFTGGFPARAFIGSGPLLRGCRFEIQGVAARR